MHSCKVNPLTLSIQIYIFFLASLPINGSYFSWTPWFDPSNAQLSDPRTVLGFPIMEVSQKPREIPNVVDFRAVGPAVGPLSGGQTSEVSICHGHKLYVWNKPPWMEGGAHWCITPGSYRGWKTTTIHQKVSVPRDPIQITGNLGWLGFLGNFKGNHREPIREDHRDLGPLGPSTLKKKSPRKVVKNDEFPKNGYFFKGSLHHWGYTRERVCFSTKNGTPINWIVSQIHPALIRDNGG